MSAGDIKARSRELAAAALTAARREEWETASKYVTQINDECGGEGVMIGLVGWCDTLSHRMGIDEKSGPLALGWRDAETGRVSVGGEGIPERNIWAGQVAVARAALDKPMFDALIASLPDDKAVIGSYVGAVLESVAITLNQLAGGSGRPMTVNPAPSS